MAEIFNVPTVSANPPLDPFNPAANKAASNAVFDRLQAESRALDRERRYRGWEISVKPFLDPAGAQRLLDRILKKRAKAGELGEASILWGEASNFDIVDDNLPAVQIVNGGNGQPQTPPDQATPQQTLTYTEVSRTTHKVRVENPDDPEQWVEVENVDTITFSAPDNIFRKFIFKNQS